MIQPLRLLIAAAIVLGLGACETVPRPFRHQDGTLSPLTRPKLERGIALRLSPLMDGADTLGQAVIAAFEEREVPLSLRHGPGFGRVIDAETDGTAILWVLRAADGTEMSRLATPTTLSAKQAAAQVVAHVAPLLDDPDAKPQMTAGGHLPPLPTVRIAPMKGLPGDGDTALPQALAKALGRQRVTIADDAPYTVVGVVTVAQSGANDDTVTISWLVKRGDVGGKQLASIDQSGAVPRGRLNLTWGSMARDIAEGGASGIAEVVRLDERNRQEQENAGGSRQFTEPGPADIGKPDSSEHNNPARTTPPPPSEPAPPMAAGSSEAPPSAPPAQPEKVEPTTPKPSTAAVKTKARTKKSSPAKAKKAKPTPRTKPDRYAPS